MYQFISAQEKDYPLQHLCKVLGANRSSYYQYRNGKTYTRSVDEQEEIKQVCELFIFTTEGMVVAGWHR